MYIVGGYAYTPEEICQLFQERGLDLHKPAIAVKATRFLRQQGSPYRLHSCMYEDKHVFMFVSKFVPMASQTRSFRFEEDDAARAMKAALKLKDDALFVTAIY
jgi:hypothetical protein